MSDTWDNTPSTTVGHVNDAPKDWRSRPQEYVYIGRSKDMELGRFGNPYRIGKDGSRAEVLTKYMVYLDERLENDLLFREAVMSLNGKCLLCYCRGKVKSLPCHGDYLALRVNSLVLATQEARRTLEAEKADYEARQAQREAERVATEKRITSLCRVAHDESQFIDGLADFKVWKAAYWTPIAKERA